MTMTAEEAKREILNGWQVNDYGDCCETCDLIHDAIEPDCNCMCCEELCAAHYGIPAAPIHNCDGCGDICGDCANENCA